MGDSASDAVNERRALEVAEQMPDEHGLQLMLKYCMRVERIALAQRIHEQLLTRRALVEEHFDGIGGTGGVAGIGGFGGIGGTGGFGGIGEKFGVKFGESDVSTLVAPSDVRRSQSPTETHLDALKSFQRLHPHSIPFSP